MFKDACEKMKKEYADKMAELCRREEEAKQQVTILIFLSFFCLIFFLQIATWEQMYSEWMSTMEKRVNNLQVTNQEFNVKEYRFVHLFYSYFLDIDVQ